MHLFFPRGSEADVQSWRHQRDWTERKYAMWAAGVKLPSQKPSSLMRCPCGEVFDSHRPRGHHGARTDGIFVASFEQGEIGPALYRKACEFGLEGMVSKRRNRAYRGGRSPDWVKVKNPKHPAINRVKEAFG